jgi:hypothetical protein
VLCLYFSGWDALSDSKRLQWQAKHAEIVARSRAGGSKKRGRSSSAARVTLSKVVDGSANPEQAVRRRRRVCRKSSRSAVDRPPVQKPVPSNSDLPLEVALRTSGAPVKDWDESGLQACYDVVDPFAGVLSELLPSDGAERGGSISDPPDSVETATACPSGCVVAADGAGTVPVVLPLSHDLLPEDGWIPDITFTPSILVFMADAGVTTAAP